MIQKIALVASVMLPLWNIPLIARIIKRRSSKDISMHWACGIWGCLLLMLPSGLISPDIVWRVFTIANFVLFSVVFVTVLIFRSPVKDTKNKI